MVKVTDLVRQKQVFLALMQNWKGVEDAVESAKNSIGSADEENEKYINSIQGKLENLESATQKLSKTLIDSDLVKFFVDLGTTGVKAIDGLVNALTPLGTAGLIGGGILGGKNIGIFKTIGEGDTTKVVTALQARKIAQEELNASLAKQAAVLETDSVALKRLEINVAQGIPYEQAFAQSMTGASAAAKEHAIATKGAAGSTDVFVAKQKAAQTELKATATVAKGTSTAMKALSIAGNMIAMWAITEGIQLAAKLVDKLIVTTEELKEAADNAIDELNNLQSETDSLNQELTTTRDRITELENKPSLSFIEQEELQKLRDASSELERQIELNKTLLNVQEGKTRDSALDYLNKQTQYEGYGGWDMSQVRNGNARYGTQNVGTIFQGNQLEVAQRQLQEYENIAKRKENVEKRIASFKIANHDETKYTQDQKDALTNLQFELQSYDSTLKALNDSLYEVIPNLDAYKNVLNPDYDQSYIDFIDKLIDGYNQLFGNSSGTKTEKFDDIWNSDDFKTYKSELESLAKEGKLDASVLESNEQYKKLLEETGATAEQTAQHINSLVSAEQGTANVNETDILSFSDAWEQLKNSTEDATKGLADDLTKLAEAGQLTAEALTKADTSEFFKNAGISAEEAVKKINELVSSSTQLQSMSAQISKMSDMLADKKNGTVASASDLSGFDATVQGLESWEEFEKVMMSSESTMEQCQKAANALATEWVNNGNFLANLTDETKQAYITQLDKMGVDNAEAIVEAVLTQKHNEEALALQYSTAATAYNSSEKGRNNQITTDLINVTGAEITQLLNEGKVTVDTANDLAAYVVQKKIASGTTLNTAADIKNLADLAGASTKLGKLLNNLAKIKQGFTNGMPSDAAAAQAESLQKQIEALVGGGSNKAVVDVPVEIKPTGSNTYTAPKSGGSGSGSDTKQTIDWIERLLDVLQKKIDQTKAKFENLFTLKDKKNNLTKQIRLTKNLLTATEKSADRYLKAANKVGLSKELKAKVQNGAYDITEYDSKTAEKINKYKEYYDQYLSLLQEEEVLRKDIRDIEIQGYQLDADHAEALITKSQALAALDEGNYKKQNKHLEGQKKYLREQYEAQIKIAEAEKNAFKVTQLRAELEQNLRDIEKQEFDNVVSTYEYKIGHIDNQIDDLSNAISDVENRGLIADASYYNAQESVHEEILGKLKSEKKELREQLKDIKKQTPAYYDAVEAIQSIDNQIQETNNTIENLKKSINDVSKILTNNILSAFKDLNLEADTLITLLGDNLTDDKLGALTNSGIAALGLYNQQLSVSKESANLIKNEINSIENAIKNGTYQKFTDANGMELRFDSIYEAEDRIKELYSDYRDEINSTYSYESKIVDLMRQKYQSELNYVKELIDQKKEALNAEKD